MLLAVAKYQQQPVFAALRCCSRRCFYSRMLQLTCVRGVYLVNMSGKLSTSMIGQVKFGVNSRNYINVRLFDEPDKHACDMRKLS